jgi:hypothetical protein
VPKFLFTETRHVKGAAPLVYEKGSVHELRPDQITRWLSRGAGTTDPLEIAKAAGAETATAGPADIQTGETGEPVEPRMEETATGFDVYNSAGVKVNDRPLRKKVAETMLAGLIKAAAE